MIFVVLVVFSLVALGWLIRWLLYSDCIECRDKDHEWLAINDNELQVWGRFCRVCGKHEEYDQPETFHG